MLCFVCPASTNNIFVILSVYFALLLPEVGYCRLLKNVYDPFLDIALLYDQSNSMRRFVGKPIWEDFGSWINNYYTGQKREAYKTRFAVMGCGVVDEEADNMKPTAPPIINGTVEPVLYFDGYITPGTINESATPKETIMNAHKHVQDKINKDFFDNVDGCARSTLEKLFIEDRGDRPNAANVVFYISDCYLHQTSDFHKEMVSKLLSKSAAFLFVCLAEPGNQEKKNMLSWINNKNLIFLFTDKETLHAKLDEVLPKTDLEVDDCVWKGWNQTGCVNKNNGGYYNIQFPNIIVEMTYPMYGDDRIACPNSTNITCIKEEYHCDIDTPWKISCCNGTLIKQRKAKDGCREKETTPVLVGCREPCGDEDTEEDKGKGGEDKESSDSTTIIIGAVIGGVLLILILVVVIVALVVRSKRTKGKKGKQGKGTGVGKQASVKDRALKADLDTVMAKSKMAGGRSKFGGKSKIEKSTAGVKGKGAKSTTGSKPSESETSSQKSKPTSSKPSKSKPTSSKASKSKPTSSKPSKSKSSKK